LLQAARVGGDTKREASERLEAIRLLAQASKDVAELVLLRLLTDDALPDVRLAAVRALAAQPGADTARVLMQSWQVYTPAVRREVIEAMLRQPDRIQYLLGELESKRITPADLDAPSTRRLLNHTRTEIRDRAQKLLRDNLPEERKKVLRRYQESLTLKGDTVRGRDVFKQQCANCHLIAGVGLQVGPDISDTRTKTPEMLLLDILNPNAAIDANFVNYQVVTRSGKSATGLIAAETAASITLRRAENQTEVILRQDIEEMRSSGQSLMPEGLEKVINVAQMADLLAFLKNWRYLDGTVPVGVPDKK
jgi:putative heme-binding domain-containing protein